MLKSLPALCHAGRGRCYGRWWGIREARKLNTRLESGSTLSKRQFQSNIIKAQQCNNCQLITENNKILITVSLSQMPTSGANCDHAANPFLFNREITIELWVEAHLLRFLIFQPSLSLLKDWLKWEDEEVWSWYPDCNQKGICKQSMCFFHIRLYCYFLQSGSFVLIIVFS